ncbi:hypothetical protein DAPPUDRAFT_261019 [Daphnia pulex]|uniref:Uncharacterized protein n=1 Tax=Daphnia pulex TaxID=6669 RepID=E9HKD5_DAPPU|nr:hypothetical protein DAPPUDRAFT_261019 [Daphnia pulex]|eukprot:EFX67800.1 hypothetical protein DAPPUDRAFT_261019 [Daphnia pulex]
MTNEGDLTNAISPVDEFVPSDENRKPGQELSPHSLSDDIWTLFAVLPGMRLNGVTDDDKIAVGLGDLAKLGWSSFVGELFPQ